MSENLCRLPACRLRVKLATSEHGKTLVLDAEPTGDGNYRLQPVAFGRPIAVYVKREPGDDTPRYRFHCPPVCTGRTSKGRPVRSGRRR